MPKFQVRTTKNGQDVGTLTIPLHTWRRKGWKQGTEIDIIEGVDGSLLLREVKQ